MNGETNKREQALIRVGLYLLESNCGGDELHHELVDDLGGTPEPEEIRTLIDKIASLLSLNLTQSRDASLILRRAKEEAQAEVSDLVNGLQDEVESLETQLSEANTTITTLRTQFKDQMGPSHHGQVTTLSPAIAALAATVRNCQRQGHPDASKHIETLLTILGV